MGLLEGKTALVTGGSTGIGLATAVRLAAEGAHVFITGRRKAELDAAVEADRPGGHRGARRRLEPGRPGPALRGDPRAGPGPGRPVRQRRRRRVRARWSRSPRSTSTPTFGINVRGTLFTVQKALPLLNDGASVILNGSTTADVGTEAFGVYAATKAAVRSFARTWANELKGRGIRVNTVAPARPTPRD